MKYYEQIFLGVKLSDMKVARKVCEELIGAPLKCSNSTFYGGDHCDAVIDGNSFELRLKHHDDGDGWSWCIEDACYPPVFTCDFRSPEMQRQILGRLDMFPLIELPDEDK